MQPITAFCFLNFVTELHSRRSYKQKRSVLRDDLSEQIDLVKYSPPIEAGASFNPPNLAKDCILRASVSEAMGFFMRQTLPVLPTVLLSYEQLPETSMSIF